MDHAGIRYDDYGVYSYFNPPSQLHELVRLVRKTIISMINGIPLRRDRQPSQTNSAWYNSLPNDAQRIVRNTDDIFLQPLPRDTYDGHRHQAGRGRGNPSGRGNRGGRGSNNPRGNTSRSHPDPRFVNSPLANPNVRNSLVQPHNSQSNATNGGNHQEPTSRQVTAPIAASTHVAVLSDVVTATPIIDGTAPAAAASVSAAAFGNLDYSDDNRIPDDDVRRLRGRRRSASPTAGIRNIEQPVGEPAAGTKSIPDEDTSSAANTEDYDPFEKQANLISKHDRHARMLKELRDSEFSNIDAGDIMRNLFVPVRDSNWFERIVNWMKLTSLSRFSDELPPPYRDSGTPAHVDIKTFYTYISFSAEYSFFHNESVSAEEESRFKARQEESDPDQQFDSDDAMYEYHSGRLDEFYKPCLLTLSELYAILHATALYSMFDLGFQIQRRRMLCMDPNLNLTHLEHNICPCNKDMCKFFEDNGLIDPVLRQLHRQSGDQTSGTRRQMFPCHTRLYGNEQLYNHMVQKKKNVISITFSGCISKLHMVILQKTFIQTKT